VRANGEGVRDGDWRDEARCRDEDPDLFFPVGSGAPAMLQTERAKAVCHRCPVMRECRQWALATGQEVGVWGGLGEDELRTARRQAARARSRARAEARRGG
jgi:WhiB family redox-sensing transcriptional regulator